MTDSIVEVASLVKRYGAATAVDDLSFSVREGEICALLGPNGAGKTTTLECVEGVRRPDEGRIDVMGLDPMRDSRKLMKNVGIQLQAQALPAAMTPREALTFFARYRGQTPDFTVAERLGLDTIADSQYGTLSTGQQRRVSLALCIQHEPRLVILDEPTAGLDVETRDELHRLIRDIQDSGATVILASHDMAEVEKLADRAIVIVRGRLAAAGTPREITAAGDSATRLTVSTKHGRVAAEHPVLAAAAMIGSDDGYVNYTTQSPGDTLRDLIGWITERDDAIVDLRVERPTLEERFLEIVGGAKS
jgi:ABC-2 type transport system ATP-binding protein